MASKFLRAIFFTIEFISNVSNEFDHQNWHIGAAASPSDPAPYTYRQRGFNPFTLQYASESLSKAKTNSSKNFTFFSPPGGGKGSF